MALMLGKCWTSALRTAASHALTGPLASPAVGDPWASPAALAHPLGEHPAPRLAGLVVTPLHHHEVLKLERRRIARPAAAHQQLERRLRPLVLGAPALHQLHPR